MSLPTYAAVELWAEAARKAGSLEFADVVKALDEGTFNTVLGDVSFDAKGDSSLPGYVFYTWHDGRYDYAKNVGAMRNLLTDVAGVKVGNASDDRLKSGVTVVVCDTATIAGVQVLGGGPGTRETDVMSPENSVETVDAIVLSGGSAFGLDAASGVMDALAAEGRGFAVGPIHVPIVPSAMLFDLANGGDKNWGPASPYRRLGAAALAAAGEDFGLGSVGAGTGATLANLKGGLGSASARTSTGITVAAIVAVNAVGVATVGDGPHFWASPFEIGDEFGGLGLPLADSRRGDRDPAQASPAPGREHDDRGGGDRRPSHQEPGEAAGDHGPRRLRTGDLALAHPVRRRHHFCAGDRAEAPRRHRHRPDRDRRRGLRLRRAGGRARRP